MSCGSTFRVASLCRPRRTYTFTGGTARFTDAAQAYLDEACAGDAALRERVEALLRSDQREGQFLDVPAVEQLATCDVTQAETAPAADEAPSLASLTPSDKPGSLGRLGHYEVQE